MLTPLPVGRFADRAYLRRFGFNYDQVPPDAADPIARELPIGFAVDRIESKYADPPCDFSRPTGVVGLTCAACHTGRIDLERGGVVRSALIEGGAAMIDLKQFQDALGRALFVTRQFPERFARAIRVDPDGAAVDPAVIRRQLDALIAEGSRLVAFAQENRQFPVEAGFGRTDALDLIGHRVFGVASDQNQAVVDAPVHFPHLWDTSWFDWVQYNASIRTPMARNIGEALGVLALLKLGEPGPQPADLLGKIQSSVNVRNLAELEDSLGGTEALADSPAGGLHPPRWADVMADLAGVPRGSPLPSPLAPDPILAGEGKELYRRHCQGRHLHPRDEPRGALDAELARSLSDADRAVLARDFTDPDRGSGKRFLKLPVVDVDAIGTDPNQALNFFRRVVVSLNDPEPPDPLEPRATRRRLENATIPAETGLYRVTSLIRARQYGELGLFDKDAAQRIVFDRYRSVPETVTDEAGKRLAGQLDVGDPAAIKGGAAMGDVIQPNLGYKARPLDGVWATPPFLHNGSVPTLDDLLRPASERPVVFWTGSTRFDPVRVGYDTTAFDDATPFDTRVPGNRNSGHEFRDLTLVEMELAARIIPDPAATEPQRLARLLSVPEADFHSLNAAAVQERIRVFTRAAYRLKPDAPPIKGPIGPALDDSERARLIAYLKSI